MRYECSLEFWSFNYIFRVINSLVKVNGKAMLTKLNTQQLAMGTTS